MPTAAKAVKFIAFSIWSIPWLEFTLARTNSDPMYGPIVTVWTNGIVDIEARSWPAEYEGGDRYHEYSMTPVVKENDE